MFSVRILITDHYMTKPHRDLDVRYSDFRGREVDKVPVVRVFGSTPLGQKTCLHIHGIFPYLYVPYDDLSQNAEQYTRQFASSLDKALNVAGGRASSTEQHVFKITLVNGIPMYGYHKKEQQFLKIYLYNPSSMRKAADLLIGGAVMNKTFQPHESHIPFPLQIFIDYNLYGMNMLNLAAVKFRRPQVPPGEADVQMLSDEDDMIPDSPSPPPLQRTGSVNMTQHWVPEKIPRDLWLDDDMERQSSCELEVDAVAADILNRLEVYDKMGTNPGLAAIWEDEKQRQREAGLSSQLTPPSTPDRVFAGTVESEIKLRERLREIIEQLDPDMEENLSESDSFHELSLSRQASQVELHTSQNTPADEDSESASQDTVIIASDETVQDPIVDLESIQRIISDSQHFMENSPVDTTEKTRDPNVPNVQDSELVQILESLASDGDQDVRLSQKALSQVSLMEEHDNLMGDAVIPSSSEVLKEDESDELEMSQRIWDNDEVDPVQEETQFVASSSLEDTLIDISEVVPESFCREGDDDDSDDDIPQLDGTSDLPKIPGAGKRRGRPPLNGRGRGSRGGRVGRGGRKSDFMYIPAEYSSHFDEFLQQRLNMREQYINDNDSSDELPTSSYYSRQVSMPYQDANRNYGPDDWLPQQRLIPIDRPFSPTRCTGTPCNDPTCPQARQRCSPCTAGLPTGFPAPLQYYGYRPQVYGYSKSQSKNMPSRNYYSQSQPGPSNQPYAPYGDHIDNQPLPPPIYPRILNHPHPYMSPTRTNNQTRRSPAPTPPPRQFPPENNMTTTTHPGSSGLRSGGGDLHPHVVGGYGICQCPDCRKTEPAQQQNVMVENVYGKSSHNIHQRPSSDALPSATYSGRQSRYSHDEVNVRHQGQDDERVRFNDEVGGKSTFPTPTVPRMDNERAGRQQQLAQEKPSGILDSNTNGDTPSEYCHKLKKRHLKQSRGDVSSFGKSPRFSSFNNEAGKTNYLFKSKTPHSVSFSIADDQNNAFLPINATTSSAALSSQSFNNNLDLTSVTQAPFFPQQNSPPSFAPSKRDHEWPIQPPVPSRHLKHKHKLDNAVHSKNKQNIEASGQLFREQSFTTADQNLNSSFLRDHGQTTFNQSIDSSQAGFFPSSYSNPIFGERLSSIPNSSIVFNQSNSQFSSNKFPYQPSNAITNKLVDVNANPFHRPSHNDDYFPQRNSHASSSYVNSKRLKNLSIPLPTTGSSSSTEIIEPATPYQNVPSYVNQSEKYNNQNFYKGLSDGNHQSANYGLTSVNTNRDAGHNYGMDSTTHSLQNISHSPQRQFASQQVAFAHSRHFNEMPPPIPLRKVGKGSLLGRSQSEKSSLPKHQRERYNMSEVVQTQICQPREYLSNRQTSSAQDQHDTRNFSEKIENLFRETLGDMSGSQNAVSPPIKAPSFLKPATLLTHPSSTSSQASANVAEFNAWKRRYSYESPDSVNSIIEPMSISDDQDGLSHLDSQDEIFASLATDFKQQSTLNSADVNTYELFSKNNDRFNKSHDGDDFLVFHNNKNDDPFGALTKSDIFQTMSSAKSPDMGEDNTVLKPNRVSEENNLDVIAYTESLPSFSPGDYYMRSFVPDLESQVVFKKSASGKSPNDHLQKDSTSGEMSDFGDPNATLIDSSLLVAHTERLLQSLLNDDVLVNHKDDINKLMSSEMDYVNATLNTPCPSLNTPLSLLRTPYSAIGQGSSNDESFASQTNNNAERSLEQITEEAEAVRNLQKSLNDVNERSPSSNGLSSLNQMTSAQSEQQKMLMEFLQPLNDHIKSSRMNTNTATEDVDNGLMQQRGDADDVNGIKEDCFIPGSSTLTSESAETGICVSVDPKLKRKASHNENSKSCGIEEMNLSECSSDCGSVDVEGPSLIIDVGSDGSAGGKSKSENGEVRTVSGIEMETVGEVANTDAEKEGTSGECRAVSGETIQNERVHRDGDGSPNKRGNSHCLDVNTVTNNSEFKDVSRSEDREVEGNVDGSVDETDRNASGDVDRGVDGNDDRIVENINVPEVIHSIQQIRSQALAHNGMPADPSSQAVLHDLMNSVSKLNADVQIIMQQLMKRQEERINQQFSNEVFSPHPLTYNPDDPLSINPLTPAVDCMNIDRSLNDETESELWERCFRKLESFQSHDSFDEHIDTPNPSSVHSHFWNPPEKTTMSPVIACNNLSSSANENEQIHRTISARKSRTRSFSSVSMPSINHKDEYSFSFHVPVPVYKRLKLNHPLRQIEETKLSSNETELIVKVRPNDARRYSLLKIGNEIVPLKRCKSDMDSPSETDCSGHDSASHSSHEQSIRSVEETQTPSCDRNRLLALNTNYPKLSEIITKAIRDNIYSFRKSGSAGRMDIDTDSVKSSSELCSTNSSRRSSIASSKSYDSLKQVHTVELMNDDESISLRGSNIASNPIVGDLVPQSIRASNTMEINQSEDNEVFTHLHVSTNVDSAVGTKCPQVSLGFTNSTNTMTKNDDIYSDITSVDSVLSSATIAHEANVSELNKLSKFTNIACQENGQESIQNGISASQNDLRSSSDGQTSNYRPGLFMSVLGKTNSEYLAKDSFDEDSDLSPPPISPAYESDATSPPIMSPAYISENSADVIEEASKDIDTHERFHKLDYFNPENGGYGSYRRYSLDSALDLLLEFQDNYSEIRNHELGPPSPVSSVTSFSNSLTPMPSPWEEMGCNPPGTVMSKKSVFSQTTPRLARSNSSFMELSENYGIPPRLIPRESERKEPSSASTVTRTVDELTVSEPRSSSSDKSSPLQRSHSVSSSDTVAYNYTGLLENGSRSHHTYKYVGCEVSRNLVETLQRIRQHSKDSGRPLSIPVSLDMNLLPVFRKKELLNRADKTAEHLENIQCDKGSDDENGDDDDGDDANHRDDGKHRDDGNRSDDGNDGDGSEVVSANDRTQNHLIGTVSVDVPGSETWIKETPTLSKGDRDYSTSDSSIVVEKARMSGRTQVHLNTLDSVDSDRKSMPKNTLPAKDGSVQRTHEYMDVLCQYAMMSPPKSENGTWSPPQPTTPCDLHLTNDSSHYITHRDLICDTPSSENLDAESPTSSVEPSRSDRSIVIDSGYQGDLNKPAYSDISEISTPPAEVSRLDEAVTIPTDSAITHIQSISESTNVSSNQAQAADNVTISKPIASMILGPHDGLPNTANNKTTEDFNSTSTQLQQKPTHFFPPAAYSDISDISVTSTKAEEYDKCSYKPDYSDVSICSPNYNPSHNPHQNATNPLLESLNPVKPSSNPSPPYIYTSGSSTILLSPTKHMDETFITPNISSSSLTSDKTKIPSRCGSDSHTLSSHSRRKSMATSISLSSQSNQEKCRMNSRFPKTRSASECSSSRSLNNYHASKSRNFLLKELQRRRKLITFRRPRRYRSQFCSTLRVVSSDDAMPGQSDTSQVESLSTDENISSPCSAGNRKSTTEISSDVSLEDTRGQRGDDFGSSLVSEEINESGICNQTEDLRLICEDVTAKLVSKVNDLVEDSQCGAVELMIERETAVKSHGDTNHVSSVDVECIDEMREPSASSSSPRRTPSPFSEANTEVVAAIKDQLIHPRSVDGSISGSHHKSLHKNNLNLPSTPGTPVQDELSEIVSSQIIEEQVFDETLVLAEMSETYNNNCRNFVSKYENYRNIQDGIAEPGEFSDAVEAEVEVVNFIAAKNSAPDVVIDLNDLKNPSVIENPLDSDVAPTKPDRNKPPLPNDQNLLKAREPVWQRGDEDKSQRGNDRPEQSAASENQLRNQIDGDRCVITPTHRPPSLKDVEETAAVYDLGTAGNRTVYCSDVKDVPDKPGEVVGKLVKLDSNLLSSLREFTTSLPLQTLSDIRNQNAVRAGIFSSSNLDLNDEMMRHPGLKFALMNDDPCFITPSLPPPPYIKVRTWLEYQTTDLDARSNYSDFEMEQPPTSASDAIQNIADIRDASSAKRFPVTSPISDDSKIASDHSVKDSDHQTLVSRSVRGEFYEHKTINVKSQNTDDHPRTSGNKNDAYRSLPYMSPISDAPISELSQSETSMPRERENSNNFEPPIPTFIGQVIGRDPVNRLQTDAQKQEVVQSSFEEDRSFNETAFRPEKPVVTGDFREKTSNSENVFKQCKVRLSKVNISQTSQAIKSSQLCRDAEMSSDWGNSIGSSALRTRKSAKGFSVADELPAGQMIVGGPTASPVISPIHSTPISGHSGCHQTPSCTPIFHQTRQATRWSTIKGHEAKGHDPIHDDRDHSKRGRPTKRKHPPPSDTSLHKTVVMSQLGGSLPSTSRRETSQLEGPSLSDTHGFKYSHYETPGSKALHEVQYLTTLSLELHALSRGALRPDPEVDPIVAVFYSIHNDVPQGQDTTNRVAGVFLIRNPGRLLTGAKTDDNVSRTRDKLKESPGKDAFRSPGKDAFRSPGKDAFRSPGKDAFRSPGKDAFRSPKKGGIGVKKTRPKSGNEMVAQAAISSLSSSESDVGQTSSISAARDPMQPSTSSDFLASADILAPSESPSCHPHPVNDGVTGLDVTYVTDEHAFFAVFVDFIKKWNPDIFIGYEIQMSSWGYLLHRAAVLSVDLCTQISRIPGDKRSSHFAASRDQFGSDHMSEIHIAGRVVINLWRLLRGELPLNNYTFENTAYHILHQRHPLVSNQNLTHWYNSPLHRWRTLEYYRKRCCGNLKFVIQLGLISRTSEFARVFGIEFYDAILRGSQYRVESMMLRVSKPLNYIAVSPSVHQRARMAAPECIPLNLEPDSRFYTDPVVVLDFQSLYPSIMIAYNYCFTTCLGSVERLAKCGDADIRFGCTHLRVPPPLLKRLEHDVTISPNGVVFVKQHVRQGVLPIMLREILDTRIMVKTEMKKYKEDKGLYRMLDARQMGLKLIANTTFGYTAASFSGRMPLIEYFAFDSNEQLGDSIVRKARETLERAIKMVNEHPEWRAKVVYGDTDSMFIELKGRSKMEAFAVGQQIADVITADNPKPVKLKFEKVYMPCILQSKKRYVGFMYESPGQMDPVYDAKGIETVRRDTCPAVAKILEKSLKTLFTSCDVSRVRAYLQSQLTKLYEGRVSVQDCVFAKEYRGMANYKATACLPTLDIVRKLLRADRRAEPRVGERVPYVIVYGTPGVPLIQLVRRPMDVVSDPSKRINVTYYIMKHILPAVHRFTTLLGVNVFHWHDDMPKVIKVSAPVTAENSKKGTISQYFSKSHCLVCNEPQSDKICSRCRRDPQLALVVLGQNIREWQRVHDNLSKICKSCLHHSADPDLCISLDCPVLFRRKRAAQDLWQIDETHDAISKYLIF